MHCFTGVGGSAGLLPRGTAPGDGCPEPPGDVPMGGAGGLALQTKYIVKNVFEIFF